jgi:lincosamide nucleotidyltransferase A/C/D/E
MIKAEEVVLICQLLETAGIPVWLTGGWGIDALLGEQTRPHKDLDVIMLVDDVVRTRELLGRQGYVLKELWCENRWALDADGVETATALVLRDPSGRELDAHAMRLDSQGNGIPAWDAEGLAFCERDLAGEGMIAGFPVHCLAPATQMRLHTGYRLPDEQVRDVHRLRERFGV